MMFRLWVVFLIGVFELIFTGTADAATTAEVLKKIQNMAPAQRSSALEGGAKSEGQVVIYTWSA
jgi:hypothetical protein